MEPFTLFVWGAVALAAGAICIAFWDELSPLIERAVRKIKNILRLSYIGTQVLTRRMNGYFQEVVKNYAYDQAKKSWTVVENTREVSESEVPREILEKMRGKQELDVTKDYEKVVMKTAA